MKTAKIMGLGALVALSTASSAVAETPLERGRYLVNSIAACGNCHTPINADGTPVEGMELAGRFLIEMAEFTSYPPNITPDVETGIGGWSDEEIAAAIREGRRPDGTIIGPPMPIELYRNISDADLAAMIAYLRSVPAVKNEVEPSVFRIPLPESYGPVGEMAVPEPGPTAEYGAYLAGPVGHCIECHTPMVGPHFDFENQLGAGGREFEGPWGISISANITSHETDGIARYSDAEVAQMITTGTRPDGTRMLPPMAYHYYANLKPDDLAAIIAYLRTLPPKPTPG